MSLPITSIYTALFAIMMVPLSLSVSIHYARTRKHQGIPDVLKTDEALRRKTRAHGNFIEYVPLALLLLALLEVSGGKPVYLWIGGGTFLFGRVVHAIGQRLSDGPQARAVGMTAGHLCYLAGAAYLIVLNV